MDTYSLFRQIADSWVLLAMFAFFIGCILWVFRPGARAEYAQAAGAIFKDDKLTSVTDAADCSSDTRQDVPHDNA